MSESLSSAAALIKEFESQHPGAIALAETLSLAVRVEPAFLREARLTLHPEVSAGAEADLWFSPLVESWSARGFVFAPDVQRELRNRLKKDSTRLQAAWDLLQRFHTFTSTVVALEERVTWLSLAQGDAARLQIDQLLGEAVQAMRSSSERALGIARWAMGAMQRMPTEAQQTEAAIALNVGTLFYVGGSAEENVRLLPPKFPPSAGSGLPTAMERVTVRLRWETGTLHFVGPDEAGGAHTLQVPATTPALLSLEWTESGKEQQRLLLAEPGTRETLPKDVSRLRLTALDGQVWELVSQAPHSAVQAPHEATWDEGTWDESTWADEIQRQRRTWEATRQSWGEAHPDSINALTELLQMLQDKGEFLTARRLLEQTVDSLQKKHGVEHPAVLTLQNQLAEILRAMGDLMGARLLQEVGLEVALRVWGNEHPNTLAAMGNLAMTHLALGDLRSASNLLEQVLELHGRNSQADPLQALTTLNNLSQVRHAQGRLQEAREMQARVLDGRRWRLGEEHPSTITAMNNLGLLLCEEGRFEEARGLYEQALILLQRTLGEENLSTLTTMANLAVVLKAQGDLASARALLERVLPHQVRILGKQHPDTLTTLGNLAAVLGAQGHRDQAQSLEEETLQRSIELFGREHPRTITAMTNLAETQRALGHFALARDSQQQALKIARRILGSTHPETLSIMNNLAGAFNGLGEWNAAKSLLEQVLEARTHVLGEAHPRTMETLKTLAWTLEQAGDLDAAQSYYERVLLLQVEHLGENHPNVQDTRARLAKLQQQSQTEESEISGEENKPEEWSELPDIHEVQDELFSDFLNNPSPSLDVLSSNTEIDSVDVQTLEEEPDHPGEQKFRGSGDVYIIRHYGKGDDADAYSDNFPFQFTLERHSDGRLEVLSKSVDTRSFYGGDQDDEDLPKEADSSEDSLHDESRLTSENPPDEDSPFIEEETDEGEHYVFVSFGRHDKEYVRRLKDWAQEGLLGKQVAILDPDGDIAVGSNLGKELKALLDKAGIMLLLVGNNTHSSPWVQYEISYMLSARKPVIVVRIPGTTGATPVELRRYQEVAFEPRAIREALIPF